MTEIQKISQDKLMYRIIMQISIVVFSLILSSGYLLTSGWLYDDTADITLSKLTEITLDSFPQPIAIAYSDDASHVVSAHTDGLIRLWNVQSGEIIHEFSQLDYSWADIAFAYSNNTFAVTTGYRENAVFVFNIEDGVSHTFDILSSYDILFTPDNELLIIADWSAFHVFNLQSGQEVFSAVDFPMGSLSLGLSYDGELLAIAFSGSPSNPIRVYDTQDWELLGSFGFFAIDRARSVAISPDNYWLVSGNCTTLSFWDISSQQHLDDLTHDTYAEPNFEIELGGACVNDLAFSADGSFLVASTDNEILFWQTTDYGLIASLFGTSFAINNAGTQIAVMQADRIEIWEIEQD